MNSLLMQMEITHLTEIESMEDSDTTLNSNVKFELGYMNQIFKSSSRDQINLICFFNF